MLGPRGLGPVQAHLSLDKASYVQTTFLCFSQSWVVADLFICFSGSVDYSVGILYFSMANIHLSPFEYGLPHQG